MLVIPFWTGLMTALKYKCVFLLSSLWVFWASGFSEGVVSLSQCFHGGRLKSDWLTWTTDCFAMAMIEFLREEYTFMQNAFLVIRLTGIMPWNAFLVHTVYVYQISIQADKEPIWADFLLRVSGTSASTFASLVLLKGSPSPGNRDCVNILSCSVG